MRLTRVWLVLVINVTSLGFMGLVASGCSSADNQPTVMDSTDVAAEGPRDPASEVDDDASLRSGNGPDLGQDDGPDLAAPGPPTLAPGGVAPADPASGAEARTGPPSSTDPTGSTSTTEPPDASTTATPATGSPGPESGGDESSGGSGAGDPTPSGPGEPAPGDSSTGPGGAALVDGEAYSLTLLNNLRADLDLQPLVRVSEMDGFARDWSRYMAETGNFKHSEGPYGENIAFTSNQSLSADEAADLFHELWIDSPGHYRNMIDDRYAVAGVGLYLTDRGWYGTHVFNYSE